MPRTFSNTLVSAMMAQHTGEVVLWLATVTHPNMATPIRLANNNEDVASRGDTYTAIGFKVVLPADKDGAVRKAKLEIDNTDQALTPALRSLSGEFSITLELVTATDYDASPPEFDTVEVSFLPLQLVNLQWTPKKIRASLSHESRIRSFPAHNFNSWDFRSLF